MKLWYLHEDSRKYDPRAETQSWAKYPDPDQDPDDFRISVDPEDLKIDPDRIKDLGDISDLEADESEEEQEPHVIDVDDKLTQTGSLLGSPPYMAPETIKSSPGWLKAVQKKHGGEQEPVQAMPSAPMPPLPEFPYASPQKVVRDPEAQIYYVLNTFRSEMTFKQIMDAITPYVKTMRERGYPVPNNRQYRNAMNRLIMRKAIRIKPTGGKGPATFQIPN